MDPNTGQLYPSLAEALNAGVPDAVEIIGTPDAVKRISRAVRAQQRSKRKAQKRARKANRG